MVRQAHHLTTDEKSKILFRIPPFGRAGGGFGMAAQVEGVCHRQGAGAAVFSVFSVSAKGGRDEFEAGEVGHPVSSGSV